MVVNVVRKKYLKFVLVVNIRIFGCANLYSVFLYSVFQSVLKVSRLPSETQVYLLQPPFLLDQSSS